MKNKITKMLCGFTIAELLITMLITMVVGAAMVPIIGTKKIKNPVLRFNHGIYECYYDSNGTLREHFVTRGSGAAQTDHSLDAAGNYCQFQVPAKANYFEIIAIGPGGRGYYDTVGDYNPATQLLAEEGFQQSANMGSEFTGNIPVRNLQYSINNSERREQISAAMEALYAIPSNRQFFRFGYTLTSPVVTGGNAACIAHQKIGMSQDPECIPCMNISSPACVAVADKCFVSASASGGKSASQYWLSTEFYITPNTTISTDTYSDIILNANQVRKSVADNTVGNYSVTAKGSNHGNDASCTYNSSTGAVSCTPGADAVNNMNYITSLNIVASGYTGEFNYGQSSEYSYPSTNSSNCSLKSTLPKSRRGSISMETAIDKFTYSYGDTMINGQYFRAGRVGERRSQVYEKLQGTLRLYPAQLYRQGAMENPRLTSHVSRIREGADEIDILSTANITVSDLIGPERTEREDVPVISFPVIQDYKNGAIPNNASLDYMDKIRAFGNGGLFAMCNAAANPYCPGYAGFGAYPIIQRLNMSGSFSMWINPKDSEGNTITINLSDFSASAERQAQLGINNNMLYTTQAGGNEQGISDEEWGSAEVCGDPNFTPTATLPDASVNPINQKYCYPRTENRVTGGAIIIIW